MTPEIGLSAKAANGGLSGGVGPLGDVGSIAETVDETLGASRIADAASKGTSQLVEAAGRVMEGLAEAGKVVVNEIQAGIGPRTSKDAEPEAEAQEEAPADDSAEEDEGAT